MDSRKNLPDRAAVSSPNNKHPKQDIEKFQKRNCFIPNLATAAMICPP
jgi:hypothetical protein